MTQCHNTIIFIIVGGKAIEIGTDGINLHCKGTILMQHSANDDLTSQPSQLSTTYLEAESM